MNCKTGEKLPTSFYLFRCFALELWGVIGRTKKSADCMKKITLIFVLMLLAAPFRLSAAAVAGDANGDGTVNITDVTVLIDYLLYGDVSLIANGNADANNDGVINISDVTSTVDLLLFGPEEEVPEYIDLGLPSGTLWATRNIGAQNPEDYGYYFAWGETETKDVYLTSNYKWNRSGVDYFWFIKYCPDEFFGVVDNLWTLELADDAAYVNWGPSWRMPSREQLEELLDMCEWQESTRNGVKGYMAKSKVNGKSLFFPAAGKFEGDSVNEAGFYGGYWSRDLAGNDVLTTAGRNLYFRIEDSDPDVDFYFRPSGESVRPVRVHNW